jgi:hypothetical protein
MISIDPPLPTPVLGPGDVTPAVLDLPVGSDTNDRSTIIACGHSARKQSYKYRSNPTHERYFFCDYMYELVRGMGTAAH